MRRFHDYITTHPALSVGVFYAGLVSMVIGAAGVPSDIANWGHAFAFIGNEAGRWVLVVVGLLVLLLGRPTPRKRLKSPSTPAPATPQNPWARATELQRSWQRRKVTAETGGLRASVRDELVQIVDDANSIHDPLVGSAYGAYRVWRAKTLEFIETAFGRDKAQQLEACDDEPPSCRDWVASLRDAPDLWELQVDEEGFEVARQRRRELSDGQRIQSATAQHPLGAPWATADRESDAVPAVDGEPPSLELGVELGRPHLLVPKDSSDESDWLILVGGVRITNRSSQDNASVGFTFIADTDSKGSHLQLDPLRKKDHSSDDALIAPLKLAPQHTEVGQIAFKVPAIFTQSLGKNPELWLLGRGERGANSRVEIEDFISNRTITVPAPGNYP